MESAKYCDIGGREKNEDYVLEINTGNAGLFVVADGLGGHGNGEKASACVAETMKAFYIEHTDITEENINLMFNMAQEKVLELASVPELSGMRSTAVALVICDNKAIWGHVGDSRLYYMKKNKIISITPDHSLAYLSYLNKDIKYDEIKDSPDQNCLLRSIGSKERFKPEISLINSIEKGDAFLLCSDGFWEYISTKEVLVARKKSATASRWLAKMLRIIQSNGASVSLRDNVSAITVIV